MPQLEIDQQLIANLYDALALQGGPGNNTEGFLGVFEGFVAQIR